jgi:hypothetical protein
MEREWCGEPREEVTPARRRPPQPGRWSPQPPAAAAGCLGARRSSSARSRPRTGPACTQARGQAARGAGGSCAEGRKRTCMHARGRASSIPPSFLIPPNKSLSQLFELRPIRWDRVPPSTDLRDSKVLEQLAEVRRPLLLVPVELLGHARGDLVVLNLGGAHLGGGEGECECECAC